MTETELTPNYAVERILFEILFDVLICSSRLYIYLIDDCYFF